MRAGLLGLIVILLVPSLAHGWGWGSSKTWSDPYKKPTSSNYTNPSSSYQHKTPVWKRRYDSRRERQWQKPGGVNFPTPAQRDQAIVLKNSQLPLNQQEQNKQAIQQINQTHQKDLVNHNRRRSLFTRFRLAWKALWKNRTIKTGMQSPFSTTGGFGAGIHRSEPKVGIDWRLRRDLQRRIRRRPMRRAIPMF